MNKDWEKEFDRIFVDENLWKSDDEFTANVPIENIKAFITEQRQKAWEELVEEIKAHKFQLYSATQVLQQGNEILSHISQEDNLIKAEDLNKALEAFLQTSSN